jgi:hypothetical protein
MVVTKPSVMLLILQKVNLMHCFKNEAAAGLQYDNNYVNPPVVRGGGG